MAVPDLRDLITVLHITGQHFSFEGKWANYLKALQTLRLILFATCCVLSIVALFVGGLRSSLGIEMSYVCLALMTTIQSLHLWMRRNETEEIIQMVEEVRNTFQKGTEEEFKENTRFIWKIVKILAIMIVGTTAATSTPFFADLLIWAVWRTPTAFRIPMTMDSFIDKHPVRDVKYFAVTLANFYFTISGGLAQLGLDSFLFVLTFSLSSMVKTFCKRLVIPPNSTPAEITAQQRLLAAHQVALFKVSKKMRELFGFPFFVQNLVGAFSICSLLYCISSDGSTINPFLLIAYVMNLVTVLSVLGSTAYVGQHFEDQASTIFEGLYETNWYSLRPSDRRYVVTMLCSAREPLKIQFGGLLPLNMENYMIILNTSYTYFMFLKSTI